MPQQNPWIEIGTIGRPHSLNGRAFLNIDIFNLDMSSFEKAIPIHIGPEPLYSIPSNLKLKNLHKNIFELNIFRSSEDVEKFLNHKVWISKEYLLRSQQDLPFCFEIQECELLSPNNEKLETIDYIDHNMKQPNLIFNDKRMPFNTNLFKELIPQGKKLTLNQSGYELYLEL